MKKIAVLTDASSAAFFFPLWHRYYAGLFGAAALNVVTYAGMKEQFAAFPLANVWEVNAAYDDGPRAAVMSDFVAILLQTHDVVIRCDVDEFLVPDLTLYAGLRDFIERNTLPYVTARGVDVVEVDGEAPLDFEQPIFGTQRRFGVFSSALNKTCLTSVPLRWAPGFHGASELPVFSGLYLLHLKFADIARQVAWFDEMRQHVAPGSQAETYFSVGEKHLRGVLRAFAALPVGGAESEDDFAARYLATLWREETLKTCQGAFFRQEFLVSLERFAGLQLDGSLPARGPRNLALGQPALVSSVWEGEAEQDPARNAAGGNNGKITGHYGFHTAYEHDPWWQVDLGAPREIGRVAVFNRMDLRERCTKLALYGSPDGQNWIMQAAKLDGSLFGGVDGQSLYLRAHTICGAVFAHRHDRRRFPASRRGGGLRALIRRLGRMCLKQPASFGHGDHREPQRAAKAKTKGERA